MVSPLESAAETGNQIHTKHHGTLQDSDVLRVRTPAQGPNYTPDVAIWQSMREAFGSNSTRHTIAHLSTLSQTLVHSHTP